MPALRTLAIAALVLCALAGAASAGPADALTLRAALGSLVPDVVIPAEWGGIWESHDDVYVCETEEPFFSSTSIDTICTGEVLDFSSEEFPLECTGSADGGTVHVECTGTFAAEDCTLTYSHVMDATRDGDSYTSVATVTMDYSGPSPCDLIPDSCTRTETAATRIAPEPVPCLTPVEAIDWGTVKSLYR